MHPHAPCARRLTIILAMPTLNPSAANATTAYIAVVGGDHLIRVPEIIPSGAKVAIVIVGEGDDSIEHERKARFEAVMSAIRGAIERGHDGSDAPSIEEITRLVKKARTARHSPTV